MQIMNTFIFSSIIIIPLVYYLYVGISDYRRITNTLSFYLFSKKLDENNLSQTIGATTISLATVYTFFLSFGASAGLATLLSPLTFIFGTIFAINVFDKFLNSDRGKLFLEKNNTITSFLKERYCETNVKYGNLVSFAFAVISLFSMIAIFLVEIHVVTQILSIYPFFSDQAGKLLVLFIFCTIVFVYVFLGGMVTVIRTDNFQIILISISSIVLLISGVLFFLRTPTAIFPTNLLIPNPLNLGPTLLSAVALLSAFVVINCFQYITYISSWQRVIAANEGVRVRRGYSKIISWMVILWSTMILAGILYASFSQQVGIHDSTVMVGYLQALNSGTLEIFGFPIFQIFLALVITGFLAALVSTADSHVIAMLQTLTDDLLPSFRLTNSENHKKNLEIARFLIILLLIISMIIYYIMLLLGEVTFFKILFVFFSLQSILFVPVIHAIFDEKPSAGRALVAIGIGFAVYIAEKVVTILPGEELAMTYFVPLAVVVVQASIMNSWGLLFDLLSMAAKETNRYVRNSLSLAFLGK